MVRVVPIGSSSRRKERYKQGKKMTLAQRGERIVKKMKIGPDFGYFITKQNS